ncbi:MAG: hypothetical protein CL612_00915 [Anaerolineaceae bacterium]|jgi:hypothetical protein|nr:hypothetical protein [Anaerolineaceae bacterium]
MLQVFFLLKQIFSQLQKFEISDNVGQFLKKKVSQLMPTINSGQQYRPMGRPNISGIPDTGEEHYFDLVNDPNEMTNLASEPFGQDQIEC